MVFRMIHVKDSLLQMGKVCSAWTFLGIGDCQVVAWKNYSVYMCVCDNTYIMSIDTNYPP